MLLSVRAICKQWGMMWRVLAYNGGLGAETPAQRGPGAEPMVKGSGGLKEK